MLRLLPAVLFVALAQVAFADQWEKTISQEGNFSVMLPGVSEYRAQNVETEIGKITIHMFLVEADKGNTAFMLMYSDYPEALFDKKSVDQVLDDAAAGAVRNVKGKLQSKSNITYQKLPGRDLTATTSSGSRMTFITWRLLLAKNRMYQIGCVGVGKKVPEEVVKKINESFRLLR